MRPNSHSDLPLGPSRDCIRQSANLQTPGIAVPSLEIHRLHDAKRRRNLTGLHLNCDELVMFDCVSCFEVDALGTSRVWRPENDNDFGFAELTLHLVTSLRIRRKSIFLS